MSQKPELRFSYGLGVVARIEEFDPQSITWEKKKLAQAQEKEIVQAEQGSYTQSLIADKTKQKQQREVAKDEVIVLDSKNKAEVLSAEFLIKDNVTCTIIDKRKGTYLAQDLQLNVGKNARVELIVLDQTEQIAFSQTTITLEEHANANVTIAQLTSQTNQEHLTINLGGKDAQARVQVATFGKEKQLRDNMIACDHKADHTISNILMKAVVDQRAKIIGRGLVRVDEKAKDCEGYQQEDTLLLSSTAEADLAPDLEIANENVKCSHGATVSSLSEADLFYLQSRGISKEEARVMMVQAALKSVLEFVTNEEARKEIEEVIEHVA